jgi:hypothetical protein
VALNVKLTHVCYHCLVNLNFIMVINMTRSTPKDEGSTPTPQAQRTNAAAVENVDQASDTPEHKGHHFPQGIEAAIAQADAAAAETEARAAEAAQASATSAYKGHRFYQGIDAAIAQADAAAAAPPPTPRTPHSSTLVSNPKSTPRRSGNSQGGPRGR